MSGSVGLLWWGSPIVVGKVARGIMQGCEDGTCERPPPPPPAQVLGLVLSPVGLESHRSLWMR